jgi:hypothetical protein
MTFCSSSSVLKRNIVNPLAKDVTSSRPNLLDDPSGQNVDNSMVHNITKSWPDPTVVAWYMAVGALSLCIFPL